MDDHISFCISRAKMTYKIYVSLKSTQFGGNTKEALDIQLTRFSSNKIQSSNYLLLLHRQGSNTVEPVRSSYWLDDVNGTHPWRSWRSQTPFQIRCSSQFWRIYVDYKNVKDANAHAAERQSPPDMRQSINKQITLYFNNILCRTFVLWHS